MKRLLLIAAILALTPCGWAREKWQDSCRQGGKFLSLPSVILQSGSNIPPAVEGSFPTNSIGALSSNCLVTVYAAGTTNLSTIYSDNSGTLQANPFSAASDGWAYFYANNGRYDIRFSSTGALPISSPFTRGDYLLCDPADTLNGCGSGGGGGGSVPCTISAAGTKDIIPQTCAGMWTLQNLSTYEATNPTLLVYPATQPSQTVPNFYAGDPTGGFSDDVGTGDGSFTGRQYTSITANNALTFHGLGCVDPAAKGTEPMSDCLVVYNQQNAAATPSYLAAGIKGIMEQIDTNNGKCSLCGGVSGKGIQSGTGNAGQIFGLDGEVINNGNGGSVSEADGIRVWFSLFGTNTNVFGLDIERLDNQSFTHAYAWGYKGSAFATPSSYLDAYDNLMLGAGVTAGNWQTATSNEGDFYAAGNIRNVKGVGSVSQTGDAGGLKHIRTASCATAASTGSTCDTTITWAVAFSNTSYTSVCTLDNPTAVPSILSTKTKLAASVVVTIAAGSNAAASGTLNCIAMHD